jgi:transposase
MRGTIGIDISKDTLDAHRLEGGETIQVRNNKVGHKTLVKWIGKSTKPLIIFEATGAYHRQLELILGAKGLPAAKVNPKQARRFAQATGRLAKTDRVDAAMLARMGAVLSLEPQAPPVKSLHDLRELLSARRALVKDQTAARTRQAMATLPLIKRQIEARLKQIDTDIGKVDAAMAETVAQDTAMSARMAILQSIPGVGRVTAITMLVDMPELGELNGKQVASLAGLAPVSQQSGKWRGKERIQGGRATLRRALYMPALVAVRFNPDLKEKYDQQQSDLDQDGYSTPWRLR